MRVAFGLIYVPEGTGATVLWSPETDADAPWVYWTSFIIGYEEMVTDVVDVPAISGYREVIDTKAMRIIRNSELQACLQNTTVGTAMSVNFNASFRALSGT